MCESVCVRGRGGLRFGWASPSPDFLTLLLSDTLRVQLSTLLDNHKAQVTNRTPPTTHTHTHTHTQRHLSEVRKDPSESPPDQKYILGQDTEGYRGLTSIVGSVIYSIDFLPTETARFSQDEKSCEFAEDTPGPMCTSRPSRLSARLSCAHGFHSRSIEGTQSAIV